MTAECIIVCWRDIPAQVLIKQGRKSVKAVLPERFEQGIDMAAMRAGLKDSDSYLEHWNKKILFQTDDMTEDKAKSVADSVDAFYTSDRMKQLIEKGGEDSFGFWDEIISVFSR